MQYTDVLKAVFVSRPNRFIAHVFFPQFPDQTVICHVKNTGRLRELLLPGATVYVQRAQNPGRKTAYDLIAVEKDGCIVNIDSQAPNTVAWEWLPRSGLFPADAVIRREIRFLHSRFDLCIETPDARTFVEVKGVSLVKEGIARFPDAPTERGLRHIRELALCSAMEFGACLLFIIQRKGVSAFSPNDAAQPEFRTALLEAQKAGVRLLACDCAVTPDSITADALVPILL